MVHLKNFLVFNGNTNQRRGVTGPHQDSHYHWINIGHYDHFMQHFMQHRL